MKKSLFQSVTRWAVLVVLLCTTALFGSNAWLLRSSQTRMRENRENSFLNFCDGLNEENSAVASYLQTLTSSSDVKKFCFLAESDFFTNQRIGDQLESALMLEMYTSGLWISSDLQDRILWRRNGSRSSFAQKENVQETVMDADKRDTLPNNLWSLVELGGDELLLYLSDDGSLCVGAWCSTEGILAAAEAVFGDAEVSAWLTTGSADESAAFSRELANTAGVFLNVSLKETALPVDMVTAVMILFSVLCVICMEILLRSIQRHLMRPVTGITDAIRDIGDGDLERRVQTAEYPRELAVIGDQLNTMTENIRDLKISVYEEERKRREAQIQFQNAQIRPHFMLNVLNSIYSMASVGEQGTVMKTCRYLSDYMRYVFTEKDMLCTLEEELGHLKEYLRIQAIRYPEQGDYELEVDPRMLAAVIPTMAIHTFVENTFKYAVGEGPLLAGVIGTLEEGYCRVEIWDNGPGFSEELIRRINDGTYEQEGEQRDIGIRNTIRRFREACGDRFSIRITNEPCTSVALTFPYEEDKESWRRGEKA